MARWLNSGVAAGAPRVVGGADGMTDHTEQSQPELLGVLLVALHLHDRQPVPPTWTVRPGTQ